MATYIPNITDVFPEPYIYKPDLAFFDKMLQRKTALYEQGVAKARSAWESVYNAPLTNKYNIEIRDQYIKQARQNLQKMAGVDFSQAQNVAAARNIFSPFWEDNFLVKDTQLTKAYQNEFQILNNWKNNSDPKVRENYNGIAETYLNDGLSVLANAERTDEGFSKIEKRKAVPFTNIQKYLNEAAEKDPEKLKIQWDDPAGGGVYMISTINGKRSKKPFAEWARAQIGNNFYEQFRVTGIVENDYKVKLYKQNFPNLTDKEINERIADDVIDETDKFFQKRKDVINIEIARINGLIAAMPKSLTKEDKYKVKQYLDERSRLMGDLAEVDKEYQIDSEKNRRQELRANIIADPRGYFTLLAKERVVENFAAGRSSIESRKITTNDAYVKAIEIEQKNRQYNLDVLDYERQKLKDERDWTKTQWEMQQPSSKKSKAVSVNAQGQPIDKDGDVIPEVEGVDQETGGLYTGLSVTSPLKTGTAAEVWEADQKNLFYSGFDLIFSNDGLMHLAKKGLGLTDQDVTHISSALKQEMRSRLFNPGAPDYTFTPEQKAATAKLEKLLEQNKYVQEAGIKIKGPYGLKDALIAYTKGYLNDRKGDGDDVNLDDNERKALFINYTTAVNNLERYVANENSRNKLISDYAKANPEEAKKYFVKKDDGTYELLTSEKLALIPELKDFDKISKKLLVGNIPLAALYTSPISLPNALMPTGFATVKTDINSKDIARAIISGGFSYKITSTGSATRDGRETSLQFTLKGQGDKIDGTYVIEDPKQGVSIIQSLEKKIGNLEKYNQQYKKVYDAIVPNLLYNQQKTGTVSPEFSYMFNKKKQGDKAFTIFNEALNPSNTTMWVLDADNNFKQADTKVQNAIMNMLQNKEEDAETYVKGFSYVPIDGRVQGAPSITFTLGAIAGQSELESAGIKLTDLSKTKFVLQIKDTERTGKNLKDLPKNSGFYMYEPLLRGKQIKSDDMLRTLGYEYTITPDFDGSNPNESVSTARASLTYLVRTNTVDPNTKQFKSEVTSKKMDDIVFDLRSMTPDEIVNGLLKTIADQVEENRILKKQYDDWLNLQKNKPQNNDDENQVVDKDEYLRKLGY